MVLQNIADVHVATGNGRAARGAWQESLEILDQLGHPDAHSVRTKTCASQSCRPSRNRRVWMCCSSPIQNGRQSRLKVETVHLRRRSGVRHTVIATNSSQHSFPT